MSESFAGWAAAAIALFLSAGFVAALVVAGIAQAAPSPADPSADRLIVVWEDDARSAERRAARSEADVTFERDLGDRQFQLVELKPGQSRRDALRDLRSDPAVKIASPDGEMQLLALPNDPFFPLLWGLRNLGQASNGFAGAIAGADINVVSAWDRTIGSKSTVVAVIDSGYRIEHVDLAAAAWSNPDEIDDGLDNDGNGIVDDLYGADFVGFDRDTPTVDGDPTDDDPFTMPGGHGAHVAGTIGATRNNGLGVAGVANVSLMPLRICAASMTMEDNACPISSAIEAVNYAGAKGARVANMSFGGDEAVPAFKAAIEANPDTLFVVAAGNDSMNNDVDPHYPCAYDAANLICVAATTVADGLANFSHWGATTVDIGAPGVNVLSVARLHWVFKDDFQTNNFASKWFASGANGGFARSNESPLTSWGITDSPGTVPVPNTERASTSEPIELDPGYRSCRLVVEGYGDTKGFIEVILDGEVVYGRSTPTLNGLVQFDLMTALEEGGELSVRVSYTAPEAPGLNAGLWIDSIEIYCVAKPGEAEGYRYSSGTSMAAPHVSGAAGLLFSLRQEATVAQVREALERSVKPLDVMEGKVTKTNGRLDASAAVDLLDGDPPPAPTFTGTTPTSPAQSTSPKLTGQAQRGTTIEIFEGTGCSGAPVATGTAAQFATGITVSVEQESTTQFSSRATDVVPLQSACSTPITYIEGTDTTPPDPPVLSGTFPPSPGNSGNPVILGSAEAGSTVKVYAGGTCGGAPVATGPAAALTTPGLPVIVSRGVTATFSATATDSSGNVSACSTPISYLWPAESAKPDGGSGGGGGGGGSTVPEPPKTPTARPCVVPKLAGKTLPQARRALRAAACQLGRVRKPKLRNKSRAQRRKVRLVVKTSSPRRGARPANRRVNLALKFRRR